MTSSSSLLKTLFILCLLFVSCSAFFNFPFPHHHPFGDDENEESDNAVETTNFRNHNFANDVSFNFNNDNGNEKESKNENESDPKPKKPKPHKPAFDSKYPFPDFGHNPILGDHDHGHDHDQSQGQGQGQDQVQVQGQDQGQAGQGQNPGQGKGKGQDQGQVAKPGEIVETNYLGNWEMVSLNSGVSAMHMQLMPNDKLIMFDATSLGKSNIELPPGNCRPVPKQNGVVDMDCFAHSVEYDSKTNKVRTLKVITDTWCSSGGLAPDGTLVGTGGWSDGEKTIRYMPNCDTCDWRESNIKLSDIRWYATQTLLGDGKFILIGGRRAFNYEFVAPEGLPSPGRIELPFLRETTDLYENNLYPFVHLAPNGNLFILANNKAILLDVKANKIVRAYPDIPGGARNYPGSGSSAILPINLKEFNGGNLDIEVLVCGGAQPTAFGKAEKESIYLPALDTCGRIKVLDPNSQWEMETMPSARVMGDMLNLPNGEIILLNGAQKGASGWQFADEPNMTPVLYFPNKPNGQRFKNLAPTTIARMYHASSAILPEGKVLVAGSNTNPSYQFNAKFPTEVRIEKFSPPYLDPKLDNLRPIVTMESKAVGYNGIIRLMFNVKTQEGVKLENTMVTMYHPPFTTHGYSMNQRLLSLAIPKLNQLNVDHYQMEIQAPSNADLAPPGYYIIFVNHKGVPSQGSWIHLQ